MNPGTKLVAIVGFAALLLYFLANSNILQRVSYDIYECSHRTEGKIKLWFTEQSIGQNFDFTLNGISTKPQISDIQDGRITFSAKNRAFILDTITQRLIKQETGAVIIYKCDLNEFRM